jgi:hypothetical protein
LEQSLDIHRRILVTQLSHDGLKSLEITCVKDER